MTRSDFKKLARIRVLDAEALARMQRYAAAYYVCGYVVECALKACIARKTRLYSFPERDARDIYTHDLTRLLKFAGLDGYLEADMKGNAALRTNWAIVKDWNEESRYRWTADR